MLKCIESTEEALLALSEGRGAMPLRNIMTLPLGEGLTLDGEVGGFVRKVAYLYRMPTNEQRLKIVSNLARKVGAAARAPRGQ